MNDARNTYIRHARSSPTAHARSSPTHARTHARTHLRMNKRLAGSTQWTISEKQRLTREVCRVVLTALTVALSCSSNSRPAAAASAASACSCSSRSFRAAAWSSNLSVGRSAVGGRQSAVAGRSGRWSSDKADHGAGNTSVHESLNDTKVATQHPPTTHPRVCREIC